MSRVAWFGIGVCVLVFASAFAGALAPSSRAAHAPSPPAASALRVQVDTTNVSQVSYFHGLGGSEDDDVTSLVADAQGNVYVVGGYVNATDTLAYVAKFDALGRVIWNRLLHIPGADATYEWDSCIDSTGNFVVSLDLVNRTLGHDEAFIAKFSPAGNLLYAETLDAMYLSYRIAADPSTGGVIVIGDVAYGEGRIVALAADGSVRWARAVDATGTVASPWGLVVDATGNSYVVMDRPSSVGVAKFASNGHLLSQSILSSVLDQTSLDLAMGTDGYLYALGYSYGLRGAFLAKLGQDLSPVWSEYLWRNSWTDGPFRVVPLPGGDVDLFGGGDNGSAWQMIVYRVAPDGHLRQGTAFAPMTWAESMSLWDATTAPGGGILVGAGWWGRDPEPGQAMTDVNVEAVNGSWVADSLTWSGIPGSTASARAMTLDSPIVPTDDFRSFQGEQAWYAAIDAPAAGPSVQLAATPTASIWTYGFTASVGNGTPPYTYRWSFGDGNFSTSAAPSHTFGLWNDFLVELTVQDATGALGVGLVHVHIGVPPVITGFGYSPAMPQAGAPVTITVNASDPDGGGIIRYDWDLGDGYHTTTTNASVQHTYLAPYDYVVTVTVTDDEFDTATNSTIVHVTTPFYLTVYTQTDWRGPIPANIRLDGVSLDNLGLNAIRVPAGTHTLSYSDVPGYGTPPPLTFSGKSGQGVTVLATYQAYGFLRVRTDPPLPATIRLNGAPADDWGLWMPVPPGMYTVSFGAVDGYDPPPDLIVTVAAFANTEVVGVYSANASAVGPDPASYGRLRVTTAIDDGRIGAPSTISVDGIPRDQWALNFLELPPGTHTISFSDVPGLATPAPLSVAVVAGQTSSVVGTFRQLGWLRVYTYPATQADIFVDGAVQNDWGMWKAVVPGNHTVSFSANLAGCGSICVIPPPQNVTVTPGNLTTVYADFRPTSLLATAGTMLGPDLRTPSWSGHVHRSGRPDLSRPATVDRPRWMGSGTLTPIRFPATRPPESPWTALPAPMFVGLIAILPVTVRHGHVRRRGFADRAHG